MSPLLNYCNKIWANTYHTLLIPLVKIQKRIIRNLTNSEFLAHTPPLFQQLNILNIEKIRKYNLAIHFYINRFTLIPQLQSHHHYLTRNRNRPHPQLHSRTIFEKSFLYKSPKVWNELLDYAPNVCTADSISSFKKHLKLYLISS